MLSKMTKFKSNRVIALIIAIVLALSSISLSVYAVTDSEKAEYNKKIEQIREQIAENKKKIQALRDEAATYDDEIGGYQDKIDVLQSQIDLYNQEIALIDADIKVVEDEITEIKNEIEALNKQVEKLDLQVIEIQQDIADTYTILGERIRASYMSGSASSLEYLLTSDNFQFQSYLERIELLERISEHDNSVIDGLEGDIVRLQEKVEEIEATKLEKNEKIEDLDIKVLDLEAKKQEQVEARQVIQDAEDEIQADLDKVMSVVNKLNASSKEYEKAIERGESAILEYEHKLSGENSSFGSGTTGNMIWPVPYSNTCVTSSYKMRTLNGVTKQHNGIDICRDGVASYGSSSVAVKAGKVTTAYHSGYNGGFGLYVVVDHGDGVKTYYAHMSRVTVNVGDYVTQGTKLGEIGNTGYSFGAHLHFGLMINGSWVNPMNYLSKPANLPIYG
ncbi:MAG: peptidoglycan DD-metalloendopeptidase family protein [Clostridia bacterium]|nr:peptidoglycan DD-metalloendopeptidase family protein [Clostridia bacterium]